MTSEFDTASWEGANEAFAGFLSKIQDKKPMPECAFEYVRSAFKIGFLMGIVWQRRRDEAAGQGPA